MRPPINTAGCIWLEVGTEKKYQRHTVISADLVFMMRATMRPVNQINEGLRNKQTECNTVKSQDFSEDKNKDLTKRRI